MDITSILVIAFNSQNTIEDCLSSILNSQAKFEIIVIDNASKDETCKIIETKFSQVKLVRNSQNIGFAAAANQGAKAAHGQYLLFLNPDTTVKSGSIAKMIDFLKSKKDAAAVGCKVLNLDGTLQPSCGKFPTILRILFDRVKFLNVNNGIQIRNQNFYKITQTVDWVSASAILVKKSVFASLGGFNENIFMYGEDIDLCFRAQKAGYMNYLFPNLQIIHYDTGKNNPLRRPHKYFSMRKGFLIFFKEYRPTLSYLMLHLLIKLEALFFLLFLPLRKYKYSKEKYLWKKYLIESLNITV